MIDINGANAYFEFGNHIMSDTWSGYADGVKIGAINQARCLLERALGRAMEDNEAEYQRGNMRDDRAVYEQALYMLCNAYVGNMAKDSSPVVADAVNPDRVNQGRFYNNDSVFSAEALRWLGWSGYTCVRG